MIMKMADGVSSTSYSRITFEWLLRFRMRISRVTRCMSAT